MPILFPRRNARKQPAALYSMLLIRSFIFVALLLPLSSLAQKKISASALDNKSVDNLNKVFKKYSLFGLDTKDIAAYAKKQSNGIVNMDIELEGYPSFRLNLLRHEILSPDYRLTIATPTGKEVQGRPDIISYRGRLDGDAASSVCLSISNNLIYGFIKRKDKKFFIEPLRYFDKQAPENVYVLYDVADVVPVTGISCGITEVAQRTIQQNETSGRGTAIGTCRMVDIAIASDDSMFIKYGSALAVAEHNIAVVNIMAETYSNAQLNGPQYLELRIRGQYIATVAAANPYQPLFTAPIADADLMLTAFKNWGQAGKFGYTDFDVAQVWTTRDIAQQIPSGSGNYVYGVVGIAALSATCTANRYQILEDRQGFSGELLGSLATHETGHNLGANHDASGNYVMSPSLANPPNVVFSSQSLTEMSNYINGPGGACFSTCNTAVPNTAFSSSVNSLCTGGAVTFTDHSTGMVTGRSWTFPGGSPSSSTAAVQTVSYATAGIKTITLTTTNSFGSSSVSKTIFVGNPAIAACFSNIPGNVPQGALPAFYLDDIQYEGFLYIDGHYEDLSCSQKTRLMPATTYTGIAEMGFQFLPEYDVFSQLEIFIDYNNDGDFLDAGEGVYFSDNCSQGPVSFNFTTPTFVPVINTWLRMRAIGRPCSLPPTNGCAIPANAQTRDFMVYLASEQPCIKYVNAAATGLNNGTSWANAFTDLQAALALPVNCENNQVWVAAGTYKPTSTTSRTISFALKNNLAIYGGFSASGTPGFADRNPVIHETILSGEIGAAINTDNSYHVVKNIIALDATAVLDGFVITSGYANGGAIDNSGAAILNDPPNGIVSTPSIKNCILRNNTSSMNGGAVYNDAGGTGNNASPVFSNCVFLNNISINGAGAAVANIAAGTGICNPVFMNCSFTGNEAIDGKVMFNQGGVCQPSLRNSIVFNNGGSNSFQNTGATLLVSSSYIESGIGNYTAGAGNIISVVSPFVAAGNFQLSDTSAAINAGIQQGAPATDITGASRSGITDMGALENEQACYGADKIYYSNVSGTAYQWQRDNGTGYANISNGTFFKNATSNMLTVIAPVRSSTGQKFRCRVTTASGMVFSNEFTLRYFNHWMGTANTNWQNIQNWSCGEVPDQYTDVILKGGKNNYPTQNVSGAVRTLKAENGSTVRLTTGNNLQVIGL